jgi:hypothetical protein
MDARQAWPERIKTSTSESGVALHHAMACAFAGKAMQL